MKKPLWISLLIIIQLLLSYNGFLYAQETIYKDMLYATAIKYNRIGYIYQSEDQGISWQIVWDGRIHAKTLENRVKDIVFGNGRLVAVGNTILMSKNGGKNWTEIILRNFPYIPMFTSNHYIKSVAYGDGFFVAAAPGYVLYSKDGLDWKYVRAGEMTAAEKRKKKYGKYEGNYPPDKTDDLMFPLDIEFAEGRFYVSGGNRECAVAVYEINDKEKLVRIKKSSLKKRYEEKAKLPSGGLTSITFDGFNTLVALSNSTKYAFSTDMGITWNFSSIPGNMPGSAVTFSNGVWWAASKGKKVYYTEDITAVWQSVSEDFLDIEINNIAFINEQFFIFGNNGKIFSSIDGEIWEEHLILEENIGMDIMSMENALIEFESDDSTEIQDDSVTYEPVGILGNNETTLG
jgi:photosystem II stability/assembly factor-like uncharacterized protein